MSVKYALVFAFLASALAGCDADPRGERPTGDGADGAAQEEQLARAIQAQVEDALGERLATIEISLEQIQTRLELLREELKSVQIQHERLAAFETEIKQALVDLGNVLRRAIPAQSVRPPDDGRDPRDRRP